MNRRLQLLFAIIFFYVTALSYVDRMVSLNNQPVTTAAYAALGLILAVIATLVARQKIFSPPVSTAEKGQPAPLIKAEVDANVVEFLIILQQEGRLIDFLQEEISGFDDSQVGTAARAIHEGCRKALQEYIDIEPVMSQEEGDEIVVEKGYDPSSLRLTGNVVGAFPMKGTLRHCGWRAKATRIPVRSGAHDPRVIEPAEIEIA